MCYLLRLVHSFELSYVWFFACFFFFKQKTAYEMRISDWSSDVCSSDLLGDEVGYIDPRDLVRRGMAGAHHLCACNRQHRAVDRVHDGGTREAREQEQ